MLANQSGLATARRPDWPRARRSLKALLANPQATMNAFEVNDALDPDRYEQGLRRLLQHPDGRRLYDRRPDLCRALADRERLALLPPESFGRAYLDHLDRWDLSPTKLVDLLRSRGVAGDDGLQWFAERHVLSHDIRHVLTGYGADLFGETALLWFSYGLEGGRSTALLMLGAGMRARRVQGWRVVPLFWKALRQGRRARGMVALPFEELLPRPLEEVRLLAGLSTGSVKDRIV